MNESSHRTTETRVSIPLAEYESLRNRAAEFDAQMTHLQSVEKLTREMIQEMRLTPDGLIVHEKLDKSDAHYRLCQLLWPKVTS